MPIGKSSRRESQSHDDWEGCSSMVREEFIRHAELHMQDRPAGSFDFRAAAESSPSPPPTPRHPREPPRKEWVGCVTQRVSISRRGEGMGSLECRRAAVPQWRRFRQGSVPGDAGGPSAFDFNKQVHRYIDYHNYSDYSNYSILQGGQA